MLYGIEICKVVDIKINGESYTAELGLFWRATLCAVLPFHESSSQQDGTGATADKQQCNASGEKEERKQRKKKQKDICVCVCIHAQHI
jgi:hypothetical protein